MTVKKLPQVEIKNLSEAGMFTSDPFYALIANMPNMIRATRTAALKRTNLATKYIGLEGVAEPYNLNDLKGLAHSYRGLHVAVSALVGIPDTDINAIYIAGNTKAVPSKSKICAEKKLLSKASNEGFTEVTGFVGTSITDVDTIRDISDYPTPTLHWCPECRADGQASPLVSKNSLLATVGLDKNIYQVNRFEDVIDLYSGQHKFRDTPEKFLEYTEFKDDFSDLHQRLNLYTTLVQAEGLVGNIAPEEATRPRALLAQVALTMRLDKSGLAVPV
jgi:hypothetical protein